MLTCLAHALFTFYIQSVLKFKKNNSGAKGLKEKKKKIGFLNARYLYLPNDAVRNRMCIVE